MQIREDMEMQERIMTYEEPLGIGRYSSTSVSMAEADLISVGSQLASNMATF